MLIAPVAFVFFAAARAPNVATIRKQLVDAARVNDLHRFDAAIERAETFIDTMPVGTRRNAFRRAILTARDIARVWHFAEADPNGIYYDDERLPFYYEHLAADYPDYAKFIAEYRLIDRTGLPQYPTRETRSFLEKRLENTGRKSP
ncbi:MAG TPA: hypothetical protein VER58_07965 [Thermoanaerobaculia bacterium]|nr:hypothetical protein [Thermoanaerobaculia bacterium]